MKKDQIALQLFTLRDHTKTPADFAATLRRVRETGYAAVEMAGTSGLSPAEAASLVKNEGLAICSSHESPQMILDDPQAVVDRLGEFGIDHAAYPYPAGVDFSDAAQVDRLVAGLDKSGAVLRSAGMTLCYHNHAYEFFRRDGATVLDMIFARIPSAHIQSELDVYWVQAGGADPAEYCRRLAGRLPLLHVKDYGVNPAGERFFAEVGSGNLDIKGIITAAEASGCRWFIVEQDICPCDPFDCIRRSFDCMRGLSVC
jgi:sugar phosphate isomerase/epimerase